MHSFKVIRTGRSINNKRTVNMKVHALGVQSLIFTEQGEVVNRMLLKSYKVFPLFNVKVGGIQCV